MPVLQKIATMGEGRKVKGLQEYEFMDPEAAAKFQELMEKLGAGGGEVLLGGGAGGAGGGEVGGGGGELLAQ